MGSIPIRVTHTARSSNGKGRGSDKAETKVRLRPGRLKKQHGIEVLAAAYSALNRGGDGSSPSGPTEN